MDFFFFSQNVFFHRFTVLVFVFAITFRPLVAASLCSQAVREKKEGRREENRNERKEKVQTRGREERERKGRESEVEACGGLWAGAAAASA